MKNLTRNIILFIQLLGLFISTMHAQRPMEYLNRSLVALQTSNGVYLSWRMLGTDSMDISFNLYRNGDKINNTAITGATNYTDVSGTVNASYVVETIHNGEDNEMSEEVSVWPLLPASENPGKPSIPFKRIALPDPPQEDGVEFTPGEMSVGDLNGDGAYELIFEWEASTGTGSYLEAIDLEGNSFWRISAGVNVTSMKLNFMVYDLNLDGKAEVTFLSGPGTKDGTGKYIQRGPATHYDTALVIPRPSGRLMEDPQFITVFNGETGEEMATIEHWPPIGPVAQHEATWGDNYGHRASSLKGAVLYTKEYGPLLVFQRGVYTRIGLGAYKWDGAHELTNIWKFDTNDAGNANWFGQGNHTVSVGDLDEDGNDELVIGAAAIDDDGSGLWSTKMGHGDANHLADHIPENPGLEYFAPHEDGIHGIAMHDAATGEVLWNITADYDVGRAWAEDVDPNHRGSEVVAIGYPNYDCNGNELSTGYNAYHQPIYFDGEVQRGWRKEWSTNSYQHGRILTGWYYGASTIHGTKEDANLVADIIGDWREEMIIRHYNNKELLLFTTWIPTEHKNYTLMHDPTYRMNIAVQNVGYNQPAHVGYYFADGAPTPDIYLVKNDEITSNNKILTEQTPDINLFPNPSSEFLHIAKRGKLEGEIKYAVYNSLGQVILTKTMQSDKETIEVSKWNEGVYLIHISNGGLSICRKFYKQ